MIQLPLANVSFTAIVDADMEELLQRKWTAYCNKMGVWYVVNTRLPRIRLHHWIAGFPRKGLVTDHINGNGLDNRRANLQHITQSENMLKANRKKRK